MLATAASAQSPSYGDPFWSHWGDGQAELCGYEMTYERYGETRKGNAVAIFVTETFSDELRVKADPGLHPEDDELLVMKLNLVQDFPTGIYDYNLMTSAFISLEAREDRPAGLPTKVSFSSQEWCGHVYQQILFDADQARYFSHSYFDGEADQVQEIPYPEGTVAEDALLIWARGLAAPVVMPGESVDVRMMRSAQHVRMHHRPQTVISATLERATDVEEREGVKCRVATVSLRGDVLWRFWVEEAEPRRVIAWEGINGQRATLLDSERMKYWELNGSGGEKKLKELGLKARDAHMP